MTPDLLDTLPSSPSVYPRPRVAILGSGISGLVAAHELQRRGVAVTVIERSNRVGGRIETFRFPGTDHLGELGAMRLPACHERTLRLIADVGLGDRLAPFTTLFRGARGIVDLGVPASTTAEMPPRRAAIDEALARVSATVLERLQVVAAALCPRELRADFEAHVRHGLRGDLTTLIDATVPRARLASLLDAPPEELVALFASLRDHLSPDLRLFFRDALWELSGDLLMLRGGMQQLPERLAASLAAPPRLGCEVEGVIDHESFVELELFDRTQGAWTRERFDHAICTLPVPALRRVRLRGFDPRKLDALRSARYAAASKVLFLCRRRFWERPPHALEGGASFIGGVGRQIYYNQIGDPETLRAVEGGVLLAAYAIGHDAEAMAELSEPALVDALRRRIGSVHPELLAPDMLVDVKIRHWHEEEGFHGGCSVAWPIYHRDRNGVAEVERLWSEIARPARRVFFAGEHCSADRAWIEGAVTSAREAVAALLLSIGPPGVPAQPPCECRPP